MAKGDFLRALYDDTDMTWYTKDHHEIARREFVNVGGELRVELLDGKGKRLVVAREIRNDKELPYVEFRNGDGKKLGTAMLFIELFSGLHVEIYEPARKITDFYLPDKWKDRVLEDYYRETGRIRDSGGGEKGKGRVIPPAIPSDDKGKSGKNTGKGEKERVPPPTKPQQTEFISTPEEVEHFLACSMGSGCVAVLLGILLLIFSSHLYTIYQYTHTIVVYASCPIMVLLFLLACRVGKQPSRKLRIFWLGHLILLAVGFVFLAYWNACLYSNRIYYLFPHVYDANQMSALHFALCFVPAAVYGLISGIWTLLLCRDTDRTQFKQISMSAVALMFIGSAVCIASTQLVVEYCYSVGIFERIFIPIMLGILICLASAISLLPYVLFSAIRAKAEKRRQ